MTVCSFVLSMMLTSLLCIRQYWMLLSIEFTRCRRNKVSRCNCALIIHIAFISWLVMLDWYTRNSLLKAWSHMRRCAFAIRASSSLRVVLLYLRTLQAASFGPLYLLSRRLTSSPDTAVADVTDCGITRLGAWKSVYH